LVEGHVFKIEASYDPFGGGGLVASMGDLSTFFTALVQGKVFEKAATFTLMTTLTPGWANGIEGGLGIFKTVLTLDNELVSITRCSHSGFGGTIAMYCPEAHLFVSMIFLIESLPKNFNPLPFFNCVGTVVTS
jgi:D-alanyl-D-alanine carboxypeptidase